MSAPARGYAVTGKGLGLRRALLGPLENAPQSAIDFFELAPENWIDIGGALGRRWRAVTAGRPVVAHGLSLNIGGPAPLDEAYIQRIKQFLDCHGICCYSEHLSYCADDGQLYDLMPIPFTAAAVDYVAARIRRTQEILERRLAIENVSYYCAPGAEMSELEFITAILARADCDLLLDVNNIYVNSINHGYDALAFLRGLPASRIAYAHIAGHHHRAEDLIIDTHADAVSAPVWDLLEVAYAHFGVLPTVLERDFNLPPLPAIMAELGVIERLQRTRLALPAVAFAPA